MAISQTKHQEPAKRQTRQSSSYSSMSTMRIAIAGTGGLARLIAHYTTAGYQIAVVAYDDAESLRFALRGIDTVISTVTGPNQIELIKAAVSARVRRFAASEFEGLPQLRIANDPLDRGRTEARSWLARYSQHIQSTSFVCGILFERFQPGGLAHARIGMTSGINAEGAYIMDCRAMVAQVPAFDLNNEPNARICITAAQDVARFVTKALDLPTWPQELRMCGHRVLVKDLFMQVQRFRGRPFNVEWHGPTSLRTELQTAISQGDATRQLRLWSLINTAEGRYDFGQPYLNQHFPEVRTLDFGSWFAAKWSSQMIVTP